MTKEEKELREPGELKKPEEADELRSIYEDPDGELPDLSTMERAPRSPLRRFLVITIAILACLSAVAWGGFFVWTRFFLTAPQTLEATIEGQSEVDAGEVVRYLVRYHHVGNSPISQMDLKLNLPLGFELQSASPEPTDAAAHVWSLGGLTPLSDGAIEIAGIFRAEVPSSQTLQAYFTYRPANFSSDFQLIRTFPISVKGSVLRLAINGPEKALPGDEVAYDIEIQNEGLSPVSNIELAAEFTPDFLVSSSEPQPTSPDLPRWMIPELKPGELFALSVHGRYSSTASGDQAIRASLALLGPEGVRLAQEQAETKTDVLGGNLVFHLVVEGAQQDVYAKMGESLLVSVDYANRGQERLEGVVLTLEAKGADNRPLPILWEGANLADGVRTGNALVWDSSVVPSFLALDPGNEGVLDLVIPLEGGFDATNTADTFELRLTADILKVGSVESPRRLEATPIPVAINSNFEANGLARYFSEDSEDNLPLGTGPLPPKQGETTTYRIFWQISNSLHPLEGVRLTATLPSDVGWTNKTQSDIGTLSYNDTTRMVIWDIPRLPIGIKEATVNFEVAITPKESDVGSFFKLINATAAEAIDTVTKQRLSSAFDMLSTELPEDPGARGKGVVSE